jgi:hypothetical protein
MNIGRNSILLRVEVLLGLVLDLLGRVHILAEVEVDTVEVDLDIMEVQELDIREVIHPPD